MTPDALPDPSIPDRSVDQESPILIVGAPRSGTSLLRALLDRHPRIALCDETFFHYWMASRARVFGDLNDPARRARAIDRLLELRRIRRLRLDPAVLREGLLAARSLPELFLGVMRLHAKARGKARFGDKTPQHALVASELLQWFPTARLIHLVRDPRDVVASLVRMPWSPGSIGADTRLWAACVDGVRACGPSERVLTIRYESLIAAPEAELRRLCEFVGEEFTPALLTAEAAAPSDRWWFERAQGAIEPSRVGRWREELTPGDVALVEWIAGARLAELGYEKSAPAPGSVRRLRGRVADAAAAVRRGVRHLPATLGRVFAPDRIAFQERVIDGPE